jgi:hypothetical protein
LMTPREPQRGLGDALGEVAEWLKAAVSKTVMGHWPIESSNLSLSAKYRNLRNAT